MNLSGGLVGVRKKAKKRNGLYRMPNGTYKLRKQIKGHLYQIPLIVSDKDDAREVYEQVLKEIALGMHGGGKAPTLKALIDGWCSLHRKQERHVAAARWCEGALGNLVKLPLPSITLDRVDGWISEYQEGHSNASINQVLRYLKLWMNWAVELKQIPGLPYKKKMLKVEKQAKPVVKIAAQEDFLRGIDCVKTWVRVSQLAELQVRAAARMMLGLGLREAEVEGARWEWLDVGQGEYTVGKAKGMKPRTLGVPGWVMLFLTALPRTVSGLIFPGADGKAHPAGWLRKALARGARAAGVTGILGNHRLRASFATRHASAGTALSDLQAMMGHFSVTTTRDYIEDDLAQQKGAQDRLAEQLRKGG